MLIMIKVNQVVVIKKTMKQVMIVMIIIIIMIIMIKETYKLKDKVKGKIIIIITNDNKEIMIKIMLVKIIMNSIE